MRRGFSLVELLVVIAILAMLMGILLPSLGRARRQGRNVVVESELYGISLALEGYYSEFRKVPPTRADCMARDHAYSLPVELSDNGYLPQAQTGNSGMTTFSDIEDKYFAGCTYRYLAVGKKYDLYGAPSKQYFYLPEGYPYNSRGDLEQFSDPDSSPVRWAVFSVGPNFDKEQFRRRGFATGDGFPFVRKFWYDKHEDKGVLIRMQLSSEEHFGTFRE